MFEMPLDTWKFVDQWTEYHEYVADVLMLYKQIYLWFRLAMLVTIIVGIVLAIIGIAILINQRKIKKILKELKDNEK